MQNLYKTFFITGLLASFLFLLPTSIYSVEIAGSSARLNYTASDENTHFIPDLQYDAENLKNLKMKKAIKTVLNRYNSPLAESADSFIKACRKYDLDCFLLPAIAGLESRFGNLIAPDSCNPFGWGGGYIKFESWDNAISTVAEGLRKNYYDKGAETLEDIGYIYAEKSTTWAGKVRSFMDEFEREYDKIDLISQPQ